MEIVKNYGKLIKNKADEKPDLAYSLIKAGLCAEEVRTKVHPTKGLPKGYHKLNQIAVKDTLHALKQPEACAWTNIFAPVEILQCFGLKSMSMECLSSFMSGFQIEDYFIDNAEEHGIASTLCSYHKNFIGAIDSGVVPPADFAVTTSMVCDGNINTFRYLTKKNNVPCYVIDIPYEYSKDSEQYVVGQLKELIGMLEEKYHKQLDYEELKEVIKRENQSKKYYEEFLEQLKTKYYPNTMTMNLFMLYATHLDIGSEETLQFFRLLKNDIKKYPNCHGTKIFWVHLFPYYQETLQKYFNLNPDYFIQGFDINLDYMEQMDENHPLEALARKMLLNVYNGSFQRKVDLIADMVKRYNSDAVINFCHWGCKQSSGGVMLMKDRMREMDIPMLVLDGDAMDRRNSHDGQIKTRLEAFLELIKANKEDTDNDRLCM